MSRAAQGAGGTHRLLADLFLFGVAAQFFLAGLGVFGADKHGRPAAASTFDAHRIFGNVLVLVAILIAAAAVAGRVQVRQSLLLLALTALQGVWTQAGSTAAIGAIHVLGAFAITLVAYRLHRATHDERSPSAAEPRVTRAVGERT